MRLVTNPRRALDLRCVRLDGCRATREANVCPQGGRAPKPSSPVLKASGLPALDGTWHYIGPFDYSSFEQVDPPEKEIDLLKSYPGRDRRKQSGKR